MKLEANRGKQVSGLNATVPTVNKLLKEYLVYTVITFGNHFTPGFSFAVCLAGSSVLLHVFTLCD